MENVPLPKLKVLQLVQKNFASIGIVPSLMFQTCPLNSKVLLGFLMLGLALICHSMFTFIEAKTFAEYNQSIFISSITAIIISALLIVILNVEKLFALLNGCESIVNTS